MQIKSMKELKEVIKQNHIKVKEKSSKEMFGYLGLHDQIDKPMGLNMPKDMIWIDQNLKGKDRFITLRHEVEEFLMMKNQNMKYWKAHKIATKRESL